MLNFASMITPKQFTQYLCSDNKYSLKDSMDVDRVLFLILKFVLKKNYDTFYYNMDYFILLYVLHILLPFHKQFMTET